MRKKLSLQKFDPRGIPLAEVIAVHREFQKFSRLPGNLGDGFLMATNPVYRNIRQDFLRRGFTFTEKDLGGYFAFPLMSLDEAIDARKIPYRRNFPWLEKLERGAPGLFTLTELKRADLKFNYLFHEAAHCIAHHHFFGRQSIRRAPKNADSLLRVFLGEAFANAVEALSAAFAEGQIGGYFLDANCHFRANERELKALSAGLRRYGPETVALLLLGAFLYSNYLFERLSDRQFGRIAELAVVADEPLARRIARIGLQLNEEFRTDTTPLHLAKTGFPVDCAKLMRGDPVAALLRRSVLLRKVRELAGIAAKGAGA